MAVKPSNQVGCESAEGTSDLTTNRLFARISRLLPRGHDPTLVLLKGHLLIEEQLIAYIATYCRKPKLLEDVRLTFAQKLRLARSLSGDLTDQFCPLDKLNAIRNRMAHHAEISDLNSRLDDYLKTWAGDGFVPPKTMQERTRLLRSSLISQIAMIAGMSEGTRLVKAGKN